MVCAPRFCTAHCRGRQLGDPLARSALGSLPEGVSWDEWYAPPAFTMPCRGRLAGDPLARSALGFPRGEAAERSEADEGWRQVGTEMQLDGWYLFQFPPFNVMLWRFLAFATPHQSRQNIGSEVPIFHRDSFPPGEAKNSETFGIYHSLKCSVAWVSGGCAAAGG